MPKTMHKKTFAKPWVCLPIILGYVYQPDVKPPDKGGCFPLAVANTT